MENKIDLLFGNTTYIRHELKSLEPDTEITLVVFNALPNVKRDNMFFILRGIVLTIKF